jgi:hypothetical protein
MLSLIQIGAGMLSACGYPHDAATEAREFELLLEHTIKAASK